MSENEEKVNATVIKIMEDPAFDYFVKIIRIGIDAETKPLKEELKKVTTQRDNLLCRIHRDGGHYIGQHGIEKACADADSRVAALNVECENLREENKRLQNLFQGQVKLIQICDDVGNHPQEILRLQGELENVKGEREMLKDMRNHFYVVTKNDTGERKLVIGAQWMKQELMLCDEQPIKPPWEIIGFDDVEIIEVVKNTERIKRVLGELGE